MFETVVSKFKNVFEIKFQKEITTVVLQCRSYGKEKVKHLLEYELSVQHYLWY